MTLQTMLSQRTTLQMIDQLPKMDAQSWSLPFFFFLGLLLLVQSPQDGHPAKTDTRSWCLPFFTPFIVDSL